MLIEQVAELKNRLSELDLFLIDSARRFDKCICFLCETFFVLQNELKNMENEFVNSKLKRQKGNRLKRRKNIKSESEADIRNNENFTDNYEHNGLQETSTIIDKANQVQNNSTFFNKYIQCGTISKSPKTARLKIQDEVSMTPSCFINEIEYGIEPDVTTCSNVMFMPSVLLFLEMEERKSRLITEMVNIYIRLLKMNSNGQWNANNRSRQTSESVRIEEKFSATSGFFDSATARKISLNSRKHNNSTSSSKSFKSIDNQTLHRRRGDSLTLSEQSFNFNATRFKDSSLPKEVAYAIALNPTANAKLKVNLKGMELTVKAP